MEAVLVVFLSLSPLLAQSCSCPFYPINRTETLRLAVRYSGEVYSGVVVGAVCSCASGNGTVDCRSYSYSEGNGSYTADVVTRVRVDSGGYEWYFLRTCTRAESDLDVGEDLQRGPEPEMVVNGTNPLVCPFSYSYQVCMYSVRVTEVFAGTYKVGQVVSSPGPDASSTCAAELGRILQLNQEYLAGVGNPCSIDFREWEPLSSFTAEDLDCLRTFAANLDKPKDEGDGSDGDGDGGDGDGGDGGDGGDVTEESGNNVTVFVSGSVGVFSSTATTAILTLAGKIFM